MVERTDIDTCININENISNKNKKQQEQKVVYGKYKDG
jgi:hypothetical protein